MASTHLDVTSEWDTIRRYLPEDYRELADEHKQVQTQFGNAKIRTADDLLRLILLHAGANLPLRQTVAIMKAAGGPDVSHVRLHKKMLRAPPYFRALVRKMVDATPASPERWAGYEVVAVDATAVCSPGAETTDARLHVQMRLADLDFLTVRVENVSVGETFKLFPWQQGQLAVGDRLYCNPPGIRAVVERGADVLVRLNRGTLPLCTSGGEPFNLVAWLRGLRGHSASEVDVVLRDRKGAHVDVQGRVIARRLPVAQAEKARARLAREHGSKVSDLDRELASYVVLFTTVPSSRLNAELCLELYRLRWQVELLFKRWKSLCGLDRLPNVLDETVTAWLCAKVLLALLMQRMSASALSPRSSRRRNVDGESPLRWEEQPWKLVSILWPAIISALLPSGLHELLKHLPQVLRSLRDADSEGDCRAIDDRSGPRQLDAFRDFLHARLSHAA